METVKRIFLEVMEENNWKLEDFSVEETKDERSVSQILMLQGRVNNLGIKKRKRSFACFKLKQRIMYGLVLIDKGNLVHSAIVSLGFWESIGGKINSPRYHQVGSRDCQWTK